MFGPVERVLRVAAVVALETVERREYRAAEDVPPRGSQAEPVAR